MNRFALLTLWLLACGDPSANGGGTDVEICDNGEDDDDNGLVDCTDPACFGAACTEDCADGTDNDGDAAIDCDDEDCLPECPEICDNGSDDDGDLAIDCKDSDCWSTCDGDGDGHDSLAFGGEDCDDTDDTVYPDAPEVCDGVDNNCDGLVDLDDQDLDRTTLQDFCLDDDGDGFGTPLTTVRTCVAPTGFVGDCSDCRDTDSAVNPGAQEICNTIDDDCDALVDDDDPTVDLSSASTWYVDADDDGFGDPSYPIDSCDPLVGYVTNGDDCDDGDPLLGDASTGLWVVDADNDGFGAGSPAYPAACTPPGSGYALEAAGIDCDDIDPAVNPGAVEVCNAGLDDDCDTLADDLDPSVDLTSAPLWNLDADGDGFGDPYNTVPSCAQPAGALNDASDCNDRNDQVHPGQLEVCNGGVDDDCDTLADDLDPGLDLYSTPFWFLDGDGDGWGDAAVSIQACTQPLVHVANDLDCDDSDPAILGNTDWVEDTDGDGYGTTVIVASGCGPFPDTVADGGTLDCDDADSSVYPGAPEICGDAIDQDCDLVDIGCCDLATDVSDNGSCYYLDGSGGICQPGDVLAPQSVLATIAPMFAGKTYKTQTSGNCCIWHADQGLELQDWGMGLDCNQAGVFVQGPVPGGSGCLNAFQLGASQLTLCQTL